MTAEEIVAKSNEFFVEEFEVDAALIIPTEDMRKTLGLDSLDFVDLVVLIESNFGFKVVPEDFTNIITFQDYYDYVLAGVNKLNEVN
jgi:acyl carrier protein